MAPYMGHLTLMAPYMGHLTRVSLVYTGHLNALQHTATHCNALTRVSLVYTRDLTCVCHTDMHMAPNATLDTCHIVYVCVCDMPYIRVGRDL